MRGASAGPFDAADAPARAHRDLVGKRVEYVYSGTEKYEHIYLNENLYTWQCLEGSEKGLADTDRCHYRLIADELYLFVWREKVVPTLGVVLVDWRAKVSNGKLFGYEGSDFGALSDTPGLLAGHAPERHHVRLRPAAARPRQSRESGAPGLHPAASSRDGRLSAVHRGVFSSLTVCTIGDELTGHLAGSGASGGLAAGPADERSEHRGTPSLAARQSGLREGGEGACPSLGTGVTAARRRSRSAQRAHFPHSFLQGD